MAFKWNAITGQLDLIGVEVLTAYEGDPNSSSEAEVTDARKGTYFIPSDNANKLYYKQSDTLNVWLDLTGAVSGAQSVDLNRVSEALTFSWMGF